MQSTRLFCQKEKEALLSLFFFPCKRMSFIMISCSGLFNHNKSFVTDGFNAWSEDFSSGGRDEIKKQD